MRKAYIDIGISIYGDQMANLNWKIVIEEIKKTLSFFEGENVKPTLRTLFYNLVSKNIIGNTRSSYQGLSKQLVAARKEGVFGWNIIEDNVRASYGNFSDGCFSDDFVEGHKNRMNEKLEDFNAETIIDDYFNYLKGYASVGMWANQPNVCEVWIEKDALASTVTAWLSDLHVTVRVNKGYSSWTFIHNNAEELKRLLETHEHVVVLYLGDLDPSGCDMERFLNEAYEFFGLDSSKITLVRLGVTRLQVEKYNLPPKPEDAETLAKLARDPRNAAYDLPYVVELDSLVAFVPQEFREELRSRIMAVFDNTVYEELREEAKRINAEVAAYLEEIKAAAREKLKTL